MFPSKEHPSVDVNSRALFGGLKKAPIAIHRDITHPAISPTSAPCVGKKERKNIQD